MFLYIVCYSVFFYNMLFNCITKWKLAFGLTCIHLHFKKINVLILLFIFLVYSFLQSLTHFSIVLFFYTLHSDQRQSIRARLRIIHHCFGTKCIRWRHLSFSQILFSLRHLNTSKTLCTICKSVRLHTLFKTVNLQFKS